MHLLKPDWEGRGRRVSPRRHCQARFATGFGRPAGGPSGLSHRDRGMSLESSKSSRPRYESGGKRVSYDLVVHGGRVFDPASGRFLRLDVGIRGRLVAALAPHIPLNQARWHVDASGFVVSPGLVDLHIHSYWGATFWGIQADEVCPRGGVTTAVDAGSAGAYNLAGFHRYVVCANRTRSLAFINIAGMGLVNPFHELVHPAFADAASAVEMARRHPEWVVGVKIRVADNIVGDHFQWAMAQAREAADALGKPLMVHIGTSPPTLAEILAFLRPGDIITHCCTARANRLVDDRRRLRDDVRRLMDQGVRLDVGHGSGSFSFPVARALLEQGVTRFSISSDLHAQSVQGPVYDLTNVLTKFLHLGLSLEEVLTMATLMPAEAIGRQETLGRLYEGGPADLTLLRVEEEAVVLHDSDGAEETARRRLRVYLTLTQGEVTYVREGVRLLANPAFGGNPAVSGTSPGFTG